MYRGLILHHQVKRDIRGCFHRLLMSPLLNPFRNKLSHPMAMNPTVHWRLCSSRTITALKAKELPLISRNVQRLPIVPLLVLSMAAHTRTTVQKQLSKMPVQPVQNIMSERFGEFSSDLNSSSGCPGNTGMLKTPHLRAALSEGFAQHQEPQLLQHLPSHC